MSEIFASTHEKSVILLCIYLSISKFSRYVVIWNSFSKLNICHFILYTTPSHAWNHCPKSYLFAKHIVKRWLFDTAVPCEVRTSIVIGGSANIRARAIILDLIHWLNLVTSESMALKSLFLLFRNIRSATALPRHPQRRVISLRSIFMNGPLGRNGLQPSETDGAVRWRN